MILCFFVCVFPSFRTESGAGGHPVALPGGGRRVLRRRAALVPQSGPQQGPARYGHGDLQTSFSGEGKDRERKHKHDAIYRNEKFYKKKGRHQILSLKSG